MNLQNLNTVELNQISSNLSIFIWISKKSSKLNNLEEKIINQEQLSEDDGLDMVFLSMFAPKNEGKWITEKILHLFNMDNSLKKPFRGYVGYGISLMVKKYFNSTSKAEELLKMLEEKVNDSKLRIVAEFEEEYARQVFERKLAEKEKAISEMDSALHNIEKENILLKAKLKENGISY